jgi:hypothetical protein
MCSRLPCRQFLPLAIFPLFFVILLDDAVQAIAVSPNGRHIAIGFDVGSTRRINKCDDFYIASSSNLHLITFINPSVFQLLS